MVALAQPRQLGLQVADLVAQLGVLAEVTTIALRLRPEAGRLLVVTGRFAGHHDDPPVGLELGEALLQQGPGADASHGADQVDRHVVGRREA